MGLELLYYKVDLENRPLKKVSKSNYFSLDQSAPILRCDGTV